MALLWLAAGVLPSGVLYAQKIYGNEWIQPQQTYLRIPVTQTGWYRLTPEELRQAGLAPDAVPARSLQLFRRGKEVALHVAGEADGRLDAQDFIEFYGERNDGAPDSLLYVTPRALPHPHYSLFSDTAAYFLTWRLDGQPGLRVPQVPPLAASPTASYHREEVLQLFTQEYPAGNIYPLGAGYDNGYIQTPYDVGEGWTGRTRTSGQWETLRLATQRARRDSFQLATVQVLLAGRSAGTHRVEVWTGEATAPKRKLGEISWENYGTVLFMATLQPDDLATDGAVVVSLVPRAAPDAVSVSYVHWKYPQEVFLPESTPQKFFYVQPGTTIQVPATTGWTYYDVTNPHVPRRLAPGTSTAPEVQKVLAVREPLRAGTLRRMAFGVLDPSAINYLIVSHPALRQPTHGLTDPVAEYARYRASAAGGSYVPLVLNSQDVYDRFNYGEPGPLGIRRLLDWLHTRGQLRHAFLIGRALDPQTARPRATRWFEDMVPTAGWPGSDVALAMGLDPAAPHVPLVPVGRINALSAADVANYLEKVKQHEAQPAAAPWRKKVLHLSGGQNASEVGTFKTYVRDYEQKWQGTGVAAAIRTISKQTDAPVEQFPIAPLVNEGVALMTLFGHSSLNVTDIDIGNATDDARGYRNEHRYPAVVVNGCALGNFYYTPNVISSNWVLAPKRGAILFLSHTHNGLSTSMQRYSNALYEVLADAAYTSESFGTIQKEAIRRYMRLYPLLSDIVTAQQMSLQGDPAIRIFPARQPDYAWQSTSATFTDAQGGPLTAWSDSLRVRIVAANHGRYQPGTYQLQIRRFKDDALTASYLLTRPTFPLADTLSVLLPNTSHSGGDERWEWVLDPENRLSEENKNNNRLTQVLSLPEGGAVPLLPAAGDTLTQRNVTLVAQVPAGRAGLRVVFEQSTFADFRTLSRDTVTADGLVARLSVQLAEASPQVVYWRVRLVGDTARQSRWFRYAPATPPASPRLPEGIAYASELFAQVPAGADFRPVFSFQNLTQVPFRDSLVVVVRDEAQEGTFTETRFRIPPLVAGATYTYQPTLPTQRRLGNNRLSVSFNATRLPELQYENNTAELYFEVLPNRTPPTLDVLVDGRRLTDGEVVAPRPAIEVLLSDHNAYVAPSDTTHYRLWLREDCSNCPERRLWLSEAQWAQVPGQGFTLTARPPEALKPARYRLRVEGTDGSGNVAAPYQIRFRVTDAPPLVTVVASPNPARDWVRFQLDLEGSEPPPHWQVTLFDASGKQLAVLKKNAHLGRNELFWDMAHLPAGLYIYRLEVLGGPWQEVRSGRLIKQ
ncbi:hypothetical protein GCM10027275_39560 [Rhabdobacter roseus]